MDLSGIIFAVLAVAWALYLIPKMLKHHDEIARTRSIDRFSTAMRVLARREPVNRRDTRLVVTPARPAGVPRVLAPRPTASADVVAGSESPAPAKPVRRAAGRTAARAAARRRRRILVFALLSLGITAGVSGLGFIPLWSVAAPFALTFSHLCLCRHQVRREEEASWTPRVETPTRAASGTAPESTVAARRAIRVDAPYGTPLAPRGHQETSPGDGPVAASDAAYDADLAAKGALEVQTVAVAVPTTGGGSIWDPLPVTLPTYVSKPRAPRTVRTIDLLGEPGAWRSGRSEDYSQPVEQPVEETPTGTDEEASFQPGEQRAVGS